MEKENDGQVLNSQEFEALVQLLQRVSLNMAEMLWLNQIVERLRPKENKGVESTTLD